MYVKLALYIIRSVKNETHVIQCITEAYDAVSAIMCQECFAKFKKATSELKDKEYSGKSQNPKPNEPHEIPKKVKN